MRKSATRSAEICAAAPDTPRCTRRSGRRSRRSRREWLRQKMSDFSVIGKPIALIDAAGKTTGAGKYTDDLTLPGMLIGKILHSPYPHARIKRIDTARAETLDGVIAVVVGKDAPNPYGILPVGHDEYA